MKQEMIDKYNPTKFRELSQADIEAMRSFTMNDIADLAKAYPNKPSERAYLVLFNKTDQAKQLYPLATWANVFALWKQGSTSYVPFNFAALHNSRSVKGMDVKVGPVQDLTNAEVKRELKVGKPITAIQIPEAPKFPVHDEEEEEGDTLDHVNETFPVDDEFGGSAEWEEPEELEKAAVKKTSTKKRVQKPVKTTKVQPVKKESKAIRATHKPESKS